MVRFQYHRPHEWREAMQLLAEPDAVAKMGGCDVMTRFRLGKLRARSVVALNFLAGMAEIRHSLRGVKIGAAVTLQQIAGDPEMHRHWPVIAGTAGSVASPAIRNAASVVGNIAQGWSVSDIVPLLAIHDAELQIRGLDGDRTLPLAGYLDDTGSESLKPGEIISAVFLPAPPKEFRASYERFCLREGFDLPLVAVAVGATLSNGRRHDVRVAVVGGSPLPGRCKAVEDVLEGGAFGDDIDPVALTAIADWAKPVTDFRASGEYRRHVIKVMLQRACRNTRL